MKILYSILIILGYQLTASAQQVHFIYLQSENGKPFYVKMQETVHSATSSGYLILSGLKDSTYDFLIGFPSTRMEARFSVPVSGKDRGFLVREWEQSLGLFDLQQLNMIRPRDEGKKNTSFTLRTDDFSTLLAKAANDSTLLYSYEPIKSDIAQVPNTPVVEAPKPVNDETAVNRDSQSGNSTATGSRENQPVDSQTAKTDLVVQDNKSGQLAGNQSSNSPVHSGTMVSDNPVKTRPDSVALASIREVMEQPYRREEQVNLPDQEAVMSNNTVSNKNSALVTQPPALVEQAADSLVVKRDNPAEEPSKQVAEVAEIKRSVVKKVSQSSTTEGFGLLYLDQMETGTDTIRLLIPNPRFMLRQADTLKSDEPVRFLDRDQLPPTDSKPVAPVKKAGPSCPNQASENDFLKLRKNMAGRSSEDDMVDEAKKYFRNKCFTTEQVKFLSALFLTPAGKYQFFDLAFNHTSDRERFASLRSEISDAYYLNRFKALVGE
jgi:hypothetical protein